MGGLPVPGSRPLCFEPPDRHPVACQPFAARIFVTSRVRETPPAAAPGALDLAAVLGAVKVKPSRARKCATLTAPARDGLPNVWAGTEGWAPRGPNKRMDRKSSRRRTP